jgi:ribosomal protein L11 methylase PrmA
MRYCAYLRGGQLLSLLDEQEAVWHQLTESQRHILLHALEGDSDYQRAVQQFPRTTLIEVQLDILPWDAAYQRHHG